MADSKNKAAKLVGITVPKETNCGQWYVEVVQKAELVEYYSEISGFYILRPPSMHIWTSIRKFFQDHIEPMGVQEASFPMFLSATSLAKEKCGTHNHRKEHVEGFAPELAWVTKAGDKDLEVPVAVRPTSEAVMYPYYAKWIRSHRDLPLRLNQWNNVVRWEAKQTTPFLRAREFLWQEGHTAHLTEELASEEVLQILDVYAAIFEKLLAVPVVKGKKTEAEKFAGASWTSTCEAFVPANGRGIQGATSHALGQNFSKMFGITVEDPDKKGNHLHVWQNSWGLSTRVIGVMIMVHGDDKGLVLPPRVASLQTVIIPVGLNAKTKPEERTQHMEKIQELKVTLQKAGVRVHVDDREGYTPGFKFSDWEMRGVPLRLEFGMRDAAAGVVVTSRRDNGEKGTIPVGELATQVPALLEKIQEDMFTKAAGVYESRRIKLTEWDRVVPALDSRNVVIIPFCGGIKCEDRIKELTRSEPEEDENGRKMPGMGMKSLCTPFEQPDGLVAGETKCLNPECQDMAKAWTMFGRSY
ncbi:prolyl-tRNA synthetase [Diaporthe helianthi]|uniref:proline--tRNA ligase n=1 Tax=Diaporthe helianthi TaxID=158607 RepID=A0A2P5I2T8_DIAHE|nr:prolyl-tRNA synthetase [Diaporthe helianthi]